MTKLLENIILRYNVCGDFYHDANLRKRVNNVKKVKTILLCLVFVLSTILAACSDGNKGDTVKKDGTGEVLSGNTIIYARGADSVGLDPINVTDGESIRVTHAIFETLFTYDDQLELQPKLAESYDASDDGLTFTIHLKEGIKFQDGTDFNADAVVFNFERWMDTENPYHVGGDFTYYSFLFGGFKGDENHKIEAVRAVDTKTVEITLKEKIAPFANYLAIPMLAIASPAAIQEHKDQFGQHPVGTGPFKFKSWSSNENIKLVANDNYYVSDEPKLSGITFTVVPDNAARLNQLIAGEADVIDGVNPSDVTTIESYENLQIVKRPSFNLGYVALNMEKEPFNNLKVRQAINMAIDKKALIDSFYGGFADVSKNPIPPALWGYAEDLEGYQYNVKDAKKLLAEAGYPDGFTVKLFAMSNPRPYMPQPQKIAEGIQFDLAKIGVKVEIESYEWATYLEKASNGEHDMMLMGWTGVMADPDNFLYPNLTSENAVKPASNYAFYKSEAFDKLVKEARVEYDHDVRNELYKEAQRLVHEDAPWVPLAHTTPPVGMADYVKGFNLHPMEIDDFGKISIEK